MVLHSLLFIGGIVIFFKVTLELLEWYKVWLGKYNEKKYREEHK